MDARVQEPYHRQNPADPEWSTNWCRLEPEYEGEEDASDVPKSADQARHDTIVIWVAVRHKSEVCAISRFVEDRTENHDGGK
jgi:hypothetical protein